MGFELCYRPQLNCRDGKVVSHYGAWLFGKDTLRLGVLMLPPLGRGQVPLRGRT
jgi:hypothetical protein